MIDPTRKRKVHLDFETRSKCDIKKRGAKIYSEDPSTNILCLAYCVDDSPVRLLDALELLFPGDTAELRALAADPDVIFVAYNAFFEQCIWYEIMVKRLNFPDIPIDRWECTAAKCYFNGYPGKLETALKALRSPFPKDEEGYKIMQKLSKPVGARSKIRTKHGREFFEISDCPDLFDRLYGYCIRDVEGERWIDKTLRDLSPVERRLWVIDQQINHTGVEIDIEAITKAVEVGEHNKRLLFDRFRNIIGDNAFDPTQRNDLLLWLEDNGVAVTDTRKETIAGLLAAGGLSPDVAAALELRIQANKSSLSKYSAFLQRSVNGILREIYQYHGAHTGRFAGRGVQPHNFTRPDESIPAESFLERLKRHNYELLTFLYGDLARALSVSLRGCIIAPMASVLLIADYAQIEARKLAWLAGQTDKLQLFVDGRDLYCDQASKIYGYPVTKKMKERQTGKVADLGYGYGGGINAGAKYAKTYNLDLKQLVTVILPTATPDELSSADWAYNMYLSRHGNEKNFEPVSREEGLVLDILKQRWRLANPHIVDYWHAVENAAIEAVFTGKPVTVRDRVTFFTVAHDHAEVLYCKLPSGRMMAFPSPVLHPKATKKYNPGLKDQYSLSYMGVHPLNKQWVRLYTWGGTLVENIVQASCRDIMRDAMIKLDDKNYRLYLHTHDEIVAPTKIGSEAERLPDFLRTMVDLEPWAEGCPIEVEGGTGYRYGKPEGVIRMSSWTRVAA